MNSQKITILDCTLRDGSYSIDFKFNKNETCAITSALDSAGIPYIEVGHGLGLGANYKYRNSLEADTSYIELAKNSASKSKICVFYIPGIGDTTLIRSAYKSGIDFIRIGIDVNAVHIAEEAIYEAKALGLEVWSNLMKSYTAPSDEFAAACCIAQKFGSDVVALVDSAGGMMPNEVAEYIAKAKSLTSIPLAFHGHNNLQLAVANCLSAIQAGALYIDTTLYGMGRSAGNAATELVCALLKREGIDIGDIDTSLLFHAAQSLISPFVSKIDKDHLVDTVSGLKYLHSSELPEIRKLAKEKNVLVHDLILQVNNSRFSSLNTSKLAFLGEGKNNTLITPPIISNLYVSNIIDLSSNLVELVAKTQCSLIVSISKNKKLDTGYKISTALIKWDYLLIHLEVQSDEVITSIYNELACSTDFWFLEKSIDFNIDIDIHVHRYDEDLLRLSTVSNKLLSIGDPVGLISSKSDALYKSLSKYGEYDLDYSIYDHVFIMPSITSLTQKMALALKSQSTLYIVEHCLIDTTVWRIVRSKKISIVRISYTDQLAYMLISTIEQLNKAAITKERMLGDLYLVSHGVVAPSGAYVLDDVTNPSRVYGVTDGCGGIIAVDSIPEELVNIFNFH